MANYQEKKSKKPDINELNRIYKESEECDKEHFAEQRSNVLLVSGDHYNKRRSKFLNRIRESKDITNDQKVRLTKNHVQRGVKIYENQILSQAPGVFVAPKNELELQDQKVAEMNNAVWQDAQERYKLKQKKSEWAGSFTQIGEVFVKLFFDPSIGPLKAYEQAVNEMGIPLFDEMGQPMPGKPVHKGGFVFEEVYGFNLLRDKDAKSIEDSPYLIVRKMVDKKKLKAMFPGEDQEKMINQSSGEDFVIFNSTKGSYGASKDQVLFKECFYRPCHEYPNGYYYFYVSGGILAEGELPGGLFPIKGAGFDKFPTNPRAFSLVKIMRPYQAEINRAASKMAEHQITLGDDKLLLQKGTQVSHGVSLPGIRTLHFTGMTPTILAGRSGDQYLAYMNSQIDEMYVAINLQEVVADKDNVQDPFLMLYKAGRQKSHFAKYVAEFERFLIEICELYLGLAKIYLDDEEVIRIAGRNERVNISEFKNSEHLSYQIKLEPVSDDLESRLGKQLSLSQLLQYAGSKLEKEDIGKIISEIPYGNFKETFQDMTMDYQNAKNDILALDRGELPEIGKYDNHEYMIQRLTARMRQPDFKYLPLIVQQNYEMTIAQHEQVKVQQLNEVKAMQSEYIPIDGALIACDIYVNDPNNPNKTPRRARVPYHALQWLLDRLEQQGMSLSTMESMNPGAVADIAQMQNSQSGMMGGVPMDGSLPTQQAGQVNPAGESGYGNPNGSVSDAGYRS